MDQLQRHVSGEIEMTATQVRAAEILLRKVLPDLKVVAMETRDDPLQSVLTLVMDTSRGLPGEGRVIQAEKELLLPK